MPQHAEAELAQHLESTLPPHLQQYAGAYVQQQIVQPSLQRGMAGRSPVITPDTESQAGTPQPPAPVVGGSPSTIQPGGPADIPEPASADSSYTFITNPPAPPKPSLLSSIPGGKSLVGRIGLAAVALFVLIIGFAIIRGLLSGGPDLTSAVTVAQEQQELIHLASEATSQGVSLSPATQNAVANIQLSVSASQSKLLNYLYKNNTKLKSKQLNLKVSRAADNQLIASVPAGAYDTTLQGILQQKMADYISSLKVATRQITGPKGHGILTDAQNQALLLQKQLAQPAT